MIVLMSQNHRIVKSSSYFWWWIHQERCRTVSTLMNQLTGASFMNFVFLSNNILRGMLILKNDVIAILSEKVNSISARNGQSSFPLGPDKQFNMSDFSPLRLTITCEFAVYLQKSTLVKFVYPKIRSHFSQSIWKKASG